MDADVPLDPVEAVVGDVDVSLEASADLLDEAGSAVDSAEDMIPDAAGSLEDIVGDLAGALLDSDTSGDQADTDLIVDGDVDVAGLNLVDVDADVLLDPVEAVAGDIDVALDAGIDLLNPGAETTAGGDDTDLTVDSGLDLAGTDVLDVDADVPLDPLEAVIGDLDVDLDTQIDLLGTGSGTDATHDAAESTEAALSDAAEATETAVDATEEGLEAAVSDLSGDLHGDTPTQSGDTDLTIDGDLDILDLDTLDVAADAVLDPAEAIVGDIDAGLDAGFDLLNPGADTTGSDDTDLTADMDLDVAGLDILDIDADINLDPIEAIVGDLDIALDTETDLLNWGGDSVDGDMMSTIEEVDGSTSSIEEADESASNEADAGSTDALGDLAFDQNASESDPSAEQDANVDDVLPDPSGTVLEGLGSLSIDEGISSLDGTFLG